jgi:hypothetical protein
MRQPIQASQMPSAQAEAIYDIALERESNIHGTEQPKRPVERALTISSDSTSFVITERSRHPEEAMSDPAPQTALSESPALQPNVLQTSL